MAERNGDFSSWAQSKWPVDPLTGKAFPGGIIPSTRFSRNAKRLIDNYPKPTFDTVVGGGNYRYTPPNPLSADQYIYKVDYNINKSHQLAVHYTHDYYTSPQNIRSFDIGMKVPVVQNWSFGVQRKITRDTMLDVAYVGSNAYHQTQNIRLNQLKAGTLQANPGINTNALRPYRGYADINQYVTAANFNYHSMQVLFKRSFTSAGLVNASYTWSKTLTDSSGWNDIPMDSYNSHLDRALANYDRTHVLVVSYIYPLPFWRQSKEWCAKAFGGWQISGVTTMQSGLPTDVTVNGDPAGIGTTGGQRPNVSGSWDLDNRTTQKWFETSVFSVPTAGTWGKLGKNALRRPGANNWDLSLQKFFSFTEQMRLSVRLEMYNAPNHINYWSVATTVGNSNFGQVAGFLDMRILQMALRLQF